MLLVSLYYCAAVHSFGLLCSGKGSIKVDFRLDYCAQDLMTFLKIYENILKLLLGIYSGFMAAVLFMVISRTFQSKIAL